VAVSTHGTQLLAFCLVLAQLSGHKHLLLAVGRPLASQSHQLLLLLRQLHAHASRALPPLSLVRLERRYLTLKGRPRRVQPRLH
jgi:hypothetical protein